MSNQELIEKINKLKKERKAIILAHNYQLPEIQDIADYVGDSLGLSRTASQTDARVIVFCGVRFMAETASILCPHKTVLMPDTSAGCPMADMITVEGLRALKRKHAEAVVIGYVNTSAEVKTEIDVCCTSGNAIKVAEAFKDTPEIIFVPDKYLAGYVSHKIGKKFIIWNGYCPTHAKILPEYILKQKSKYPQAKVLVHPECQATTVKLADEVLSTEGMIRYVAKSPDKEFIIATEVGILYRLRKDNPGKKFYPASEQAICPNMKLTTLEKVLWSLEDMKHEIKISEEVRQKALKGVEKMLKIK
jgi:quinolinate synthase